MSPKSWILALATLALAACGDSKPAAAPEPGAPAPAVSRSLTLGAYTTPREAYAEILPAFAARWKADTGETLTFQESYQGSGAQARAVIGGFEADVVALSLDPDVQKLAEAGLITRDWRAGEHGGMVSRSVVVLAVRPGNPKNIKGWEDLLRDDVEVLTPNVRTSGGAMWNVAGIWGAALRGRISGVPANDKAAAQAFLGKALRRVKVMDKGARESMMSFERGVGDVAITYENEVLVSKAQGRPMDYVVPSATLLIENPAAVVDGWASKHGNTAVADAFVAFLHTPAAQDVFSRHGLRPVGAPAPETLPKPADLFTISDLGGWPALQAELFGKGGVYDQAMGEASEGGGAK